MPEHEHGLYHHGHPAKAGAHNSGGGALGNELGSSHDAIKDLRTAAREGDVGAKGALAHGADAPIHIGQPNGSDEGIKPPSAQERKKDLAERTQEFQSGKPDLRELARTSAGAQRGGQTEPSTWDENPADVLTDVTTSKGEDSGTGAWDSATTDISGAPTRAH